MLEGSSCMTLIPGRRFSTPSIFPAGRRKDLSTVGDRGAAGERWHILNRYGPQEPAARAIPSRPESLHRFAVSLEAEGGRPQPTGDLYLVGQA